MLSLQFLSILIRPGITDQESESDIPTLMAFFLSSHSYEPVFACRSPTNIEDCNATAVNYPDLPTMQAKVGVLL